MTKFTKILMIIWACLAILSFVCAFFCPLFIKITGIAFGVLNTLTIMSWVLLYIQGIFNVNTNNDALQL